MTTTTVRRGAGRATANARTNKHSQRTPLPPKGAIETPVESDNPKYGAMTLAEIRKAALDAGIPGAMRLTKGKALNALLEHERTSKEIAEHGKRTTVPLQRKPARKASSKPVAATDGTSRSDPKAKDFETVAASLGWATAREAQPDDRLTVVATRGDERIGIEWMAGVFQPPCIYSLAGRTIQLRNASAAKQRMAMDPEKASEEATRVVNRQYNAVERKAAPRRRKLNLDFGTMLDEEVIDALQGKKITWINNISKNEESSRIPLNKEVRKLANRAKIHEGPRGREIWFIDNSGFRHVLLSAIVAVR
jgi:hypothetical protein